MSKLILGVLCVTVVPLGLTATVFGQAAAEYGILGSKPPPKVTDLGKAAGENVQGGTKRVPPARQAATQTSPQPQPAGKTKGPLIIERRGNHYERVN